MSSKSVHLALPLKGEAPKAEASCRSFKVSRDRSALKQVSSNNTNFPFLGALPACPPKPVVSAAAAAAQSRRPLAMVAIAAVTLLSTRLSRLCQMATARGETVAGRMEAPRVTARAMVVRVAAVWVRRRIRPDERDCSSLPVLPMPVATRLNHPP